MSHTALREALRAEGGALADALTDAAGDGAAGDGAVHDGAPQIAARGPRVAGHESEYELLLEMILEGSLLHYGTPRVLRCEDPDLALLLGDQLYALGLSRLAELGDLEAVAELADLISLLAQAEAAGDARLAGAVWQAGAVAIGWGSSGAHEAAKARARAGDGRAAAALHDAHRSAIAGNGSRAS
ncbi:MAG: hypothetical protein ABSH51_22100 [Solirubrobacteraceae bacterium]